VAGLAICIAGGLALGPLLGGILAQYAPGPRVTPFAVHLALVVICIIWPRGFPAGRQRLPGRWRLGSLHVPEAVRTGFPLIAVSSFLPWSVLGGFSAVIATLMTIILHTFAGAQTLPAVAAVGTRGRLHLGRGAGQARAVLNDCELLPGRGSWRTISGAAFHGAPVRTPHAPMPV
jgi:hypothetical protein